MSSEALAQAMALHRAGRIAEAEGVYRQVIGQGDRAAGWAQAKQLLGLIAVQRGDLAGGAGLIEEALEREPGVAEYWMNLGEVQRRRGRLAEAVEALQKAVALEPGNAYGFYNLGVALRESGAWEAAAAAFAKAVEWSPGLMEAWNHWGLALLELGRLGEAVGVVDRVLGMTAGRVPAEFHNTRGRGLWELGRHEEALAAFERATAEKPTYAPAWVNRGAAYVQLGRREEAVAAYRKAAILEPGGGSARTLLELAQALFDAGEPAEAEVTCRRAIALEPGNAFAHRTLGVILGQLGEKRHAEAEAAYARSLALCAEQGREAPADWVYEHEAMRGGAGLARAPESFVRDLFDGYALKFDEHLVEGLGYQMPAELREEVLKVAGPARPWRVVDLGCGTGLAGMAIRPYAQWVVGVDLAPKMVEQARLRGVYDELLVEDGEQALAGMAAESVELVLAADVFIYLGELEGVLRQAERVLVAGGLVGFSVENAPGVAEGFRLLARGRFGHTVAYVKEMATKVGLEVLVIREAFIRGDVPPGWLAVLRKPLRSAGS